MIMTEKIHTTDPNVGTRNWKRFILVDDEGKPVRESEAPLSFRTSTGERPTDEWLFEDGYRGYDYVIPPSYNKFEQVCEATPISQLKLDNKTKCFVQTYTIRDMNDDEKYEASIVLKREINEWRDLRIRKGCSVRVTGLENRVEIMGTEENMRNISNLAQLATDNTLNKVNDIIWFRDSNNVVHSLTPAQMLEVWRKSMGYVSAVYATAWNMKDRNPIPQDYQAQNLWPDRMID